MSKRIKDEPKPEYKVSMAEIEEAQELINGTPILAFEHSSTQIIADDKGEYQIAETVAWIKIATEFRREMLRKFKGARLAVFLCVCLHINKDNQSRPTIKTIAEETGYSTREVMRSIQELKDDRIFDILRHHRHPNIYQVNAFVAYGDKKSPKVMMSQKSPKNKKDVAKVTQLGDAGVTPSRTIKEEPKKEEPLCADAPIETPSEPLKEKTLTPQQQMIHDLCHVMGMDDHLNGKRLARLASELLKQKYEPCQVISIYGAGGIYWRDDWRGQRGQTPNEIAVRETIAKLSNPNGVTTHDTRNPNTQTATIGRLKSPDD